MFTPTSFGLLISSISKKLANSRLYKARLLEPKQDSSHSLFHQHLSRDKGAVSYPIDQKLGIRDVCEAVIHIGGMPKEGMVPWLQDTSRVMGHPSLD